MKSKGGADNDGECLGALVRSGAGYEGVAAAADFACITVLSS